MPNDAPPEGNALSASSLSHYMAASLPSNTSPQIKTAFDAVALAAHAAMIAVGFRLIGLGEDHRIDASSDSGRPQPLPTEWNASNGSYSFRYAHTQSSMEFLLKVSRMANKAIFMGMGIGDDRTCSFDIAVRDYISEGNLPATPVTDDNSEDDRKKVITDVLISQGRLSDFGSLLRLSIIQKLIPGLHKAGYEETRESQSSRREAPAAREPEQPRHDPLREDRQPPARPHPLHDPLAQPRRPGPMPDPMPGFEDEHEVFRPPRGGFPGAMPRYGDRDLYPQGLGPRDPLYGGVGLGLGPPGGGGMHPTFDDPLFQGQGLRGEPYDPQAPPGSRYDPVGPGMGGPPRGGMGGRPHNPFGGFGGGDFI